MKSDRKPLFLIAFGIACLFTAFQSNAQTLLYFRSQTGDLIGGGQTRTYAAPTYSFSSSAQSASQVQVNFNGPNYGVLTFQLPNNLPLTVGSYVAPPNNSGGSPVAPYLSVSLSWSCQLSSGTFRILDIARGPNNTVTSLAVDFVQRCGNSAAVLQGQLRYNSLVSIDTVRRTPDAMVFQPQTGVEPGTTIASNSASVSALDVAAPISVTGGEYSIDGAAFTSVAGTVSSGASVRVRLTAPGAENRRASATLDVGGYQTPFVVTTRTGIQPQPAGEPLVVLYSQPQYNGTASTEVLSPGTLKRIVLSKATNNSIPGISVIGADENASNDYYSWSLSLFTGSSMPAVGTYENLPASYLYGSPYLAMTNSGSGTYCQYTPPRQRVVIHEVAYAADNTPTTLAMDVVQECGVASYGPSRRYAFIRVNSTIPIDYARRAPIPFAFPGIKDAAVSTAYVSATGSAQGITEAVPISISNGEYAIDAGTYTSADGTINAGQQVKVRTTSAATVNTLTTAMLRMGGVEYPFRVGTAPGPAPQAPDRNIIFSVVIPADPAAAPAIANFSGASLHLVTLSRNGPTRSFFVSATPFDPYVAYPARTVMFSMPNDGYVTPGDWTVTGSSGTLPPGMPYVSLSNGPGCSSYSFVKSRLIIREIEYSAADAVTRLAADIVYTCFSGDSNAVAYHFIRFNSTLPIEHTRTLPAPLEFPAVIGAEPGTTVISASVTIGGINVTVPVSITGGEYSIDDGPFTASPGTIGLGQRIRIRVNAPALPDRTASATLTAGSGSASFLVGTRADAFPQPHDAAPLAVLYEQNRQTGGLTQTVISPATLGTVGQSAYGGDSGNVVMEIKRANLAQGQQGNPQRWLYYFFPKPGTTLAPGTYVTTSRTATVDGPGFDVYSEYTTAARCAASWYAVGSYVARRVVFRIHEIERTISGEVLRLAADFAETCAADGDDTNVPVAAVIGFIRFNSNWPIDHQIRQPVPLVFPPVLDAAPSAIVESAELALKGFAGTLVMTVANGEASIDGDAYGAQLRMVSAGQRVRVRTTAPGQANQIKSATLTVGDAPSTFKVGSAPGLGPNAGGNPLVYLVSQGNEPLGQGRTYVLSAATLNSVSATVYNSGTIQVETPQYPSGPAGFWRFQFAGTGGQLPALGTYSNPLGYYSTSQPLMSISGPGFYCGYPASYSEFAVREIVVSGSTVLALAIDFVHYCSGNTDPLFGYIRFNSSIAITLPPDTDPSPFTIGQVSGVARNTPVVSQSFTPSGFTVAVPISINGGEFSVNGGAFGASPGILQPGQSVRVRLTSAPDFATSRSATLTIGGRSAIFLVSTGYRDADPEGLAFTSRIDVPRNTTVYSETRLVENINDTIGITVSGGEYSISGGPFTSGPGSIQAGQTLQLRLTTSANYNTTTVMQVQVGDRALAFSARTGSQAVLVLDITGAGRVRASAIGLDCSAPCSTLLDQGTALDLVPEPAAGYGFAGWSGACSGSGNCNLVAGLTNSITATFVDLRPLAPVIAQTIGGDAAASFRITQPLVGGGLPVNSWTVSCTPGTRSGSSTGEWVTLTGLTNGTTYACTATASNAAGTSPPSAPVSVTPAAGATPLLIAVVSRKQHGPTVFDLELDASAPINGAITIEPRAPATGHEIVFVLNTLVTASGATSIEDGSGSPIMPDAVSVFGNEVRVKLAPNMADGKRVKVRLTGINGLLDATVSAGFLIGDVSANGQIGVGDVLATKAHSGQPVARENFWFDINLSGAVGAGDVIAVKRRIGNTLQ